MAEHESTGQCEHQTLQEVFVSVTGETVITDRQTQETDRKVHNLTESDSSPDDQEFDADSVATGLEDAIGDPESD